MYQPPNELDGENTLYWNLSLLSVWMDEIMIPGIEVCHECGGVIIEDSDIHTLNMLEDSWDCECPRLNPDEEYGR